MFHKRVLNFILAMSLLIHMPICCDEVILVLHSLTIRTTPSPSMYREVRRFRTETHLMQNITFLQNTIVKITCQSSCLIVAKM